MRMFVIAKYAEGTGHPAFMELFKTSACSVDFTAEGYVCHTLLKYDDFIKWYNDHNMTQYEWNDRDTELLSNTLILVKGRCAVIDDKLRVYLAEDDSMISDREAKACGLWGQILDKLYENHLSK